MPFEEIGFKGTNDELRVISELIVKKTEALETAREQYLLARANWEQGRSRALLEAKIREPQLTQSEIAAQARLNAYDSEIVRIRAESSYRRLANEVRALRDRLEALQEISYNLRRESQL